MHVGGREEIKKKERGRMGGIREGEGGRVCVCDRERVCERERGRQ